MAESKLFLSWTYEDHVLQARCSLIEDLVRYVLIGAEHPYGGPRAHPEARVFEADVKSRLYEMFRPHATLKSGKRMTQDGGDTRELLHAAFADSLPYSQIDKIKAIPHFRDDGVRSDFGKRFHARMISMCSEAEPSVEGAYDQARANLQQVEAQIVSLHTLYSLLRTSQYSQVPDLLGFDAIRKTLLERRQVFRQNYVMFAGLIGGWKAKAAICHLARETCHKEDQSDVQYSLIHFLMSGGVLPGRWSSEVETKFRDDIAAKYRECDEL